MKLCSWKVEGESYLSTIKNPPPSLLICYDHTHTPPRNQNPSTVLNSKQPVVNNLKQRVLQTKYITNGVVKAMKLLLKQPMSNHSCANNLQASHWERPVHGENNKARRPSNHTRENPTLHPHIFYLHPRYLRTARRLKSNNCRRKQTRCRFHSQIQQAPAPRIIK